MKTGFAGAVVEVCAIHDARGGIDSMHLRAAARAFFEDRAGRMLQLLEDFRAIVTARLTVPADVFANGHFGGLWEEVISYQ
ncbi:MAG: hypothetical protein A2X46_18705 [Lentisphaerae bacterium GWF2_57_35]|nr:MAG: hypothetical protein A2X46_18705 [Lentisphaerae bacterium GWF2_57_35]